MPKPTFLDPLLKRNANPMQLVTDEGAVIATLVSLACDSETRRRGLLGRDHFPTGEALIIAPCNAIHTLFMRFTIDVLYTDRNGLVLKVRERVRPWRASGSLRAFATIELPEGTIQASGVKTGNTVRLLESDSVCLG